MSRARLITCVLLPFAAGYYLSYLFRTINALIAGDLTAELGLSAADLGFLTSVYFLVFAAVQLPLGAMLDRYGPRTIQSSLLLLASVGSLIFATADGLIWLLVGRAVLGVGVALALMAGFKAIVLWFPAGRIALANGWLVMLGALGAVTATAPAEVVIQALGWRGLFALLAGLSALAALLVLFAVPEPTGTRTAPAVLKGVSLWAIYRDRRFWRIAPLSAVGIGTSWSLQGLWAAPWLRDVNGLDRADVVQHLSVMAIAVCFSALLLGMATERLRRRGVKTESVLASTLILSMSAQTALVCGWPIPAYVLWAVIAAAGAATVLSFAILSEYFPKEMSGRANAALNLLHVGGAFVLQSATGLIIEQWPAADGIYPADAHQAAMAVGLLLQLAALAWFALSTRSRLLPAMQGVVRRVAANRRPPPASASIRSATALWSEQSRLARRQAAGWRLAAAASAALCVALATAVASTIGHANLVAHIVETDRSIASTHRSIMPDATAEMIVVAADASGLPLLPKVPPLLSVHRSVVHRTAYGLSASSPAEFVGTGPRQNRNSPEKNRTDQMNGDPLMLMRVANPGLTDYPVRSVEKLRYADTDRQGHISNAVFAVCCQNARMELLCDQKRVPLPPNTQFAIAKLVLEFRAEMYWPGDVVVGTRVARIGSSSVVLAQALYVDERCVAVADSTVVLMDGATRRSTPLPPQTVQALNGLARPVPKRVLALAALSLRTPNLRAVAKRAMKVVGLGA